MAKGYPPREVELVVHPGPVRGPSLYIQQDHFQQGRNLPGPRSLLAPSMLPMRRRNDPQDWIDGLLDHQSGVVSHAQLVGIGVPAKSARRWKRGWRRMAPGIYCVREPDWESWCWAGVLHCADGGVVGGLAAAHLHGLTSGQPERITVWNPGQRRIPPIGDERVGVTFRRAVRTGRGAPPRTGVEDTVMDLAAEGTEDEVVAVLTRALAQKVTSGPRMARALGGRLRVPFRRLILEVCDHGATGVESVLEWRFLQLVIKAHGLPEPERQVSLSPGTRADGLWTDAGVVLELDGRMGHEGAFRDMARDNRMTARGLVTLRYGWHDVINRPCEVAWQVHQVLRSRGWDGLRQRCGRCRRSGLA